MLILKQYWYNTLVKIDYNADKKLPPDGDKR
jgi:hypothetical protein